MKRLGRKTRRLMTIGLTNKEVAEGRKEGRKYIERQKFTIPYTKISLSISPLIV